MDFLSKITVPEKVTLAIVGAVIIGIIGGRLFMRFVYNLFLRYFDNIENTLKEMRDSIRELYARTDNHEEIRDTVRYCKNKNRKKR
jgi:hypothetical protein